MSDLTVSWDCTLRPKGGMVIKGVGRTTPVFRNEDSQLAAITWYATKSAHIDTGRFIQRAYSYQAPGIPSDSCQVGRPCGGSGGNTINHSLIPSDQSTSQGEYQLVVPRENVLNEYTHDDASIQDGRWQHANMLPLLDGDIQRQAIGAWLYQSSPRILSVIAREGSSRGGSDFLIGYEIFLGRPLGEYEEKDEGEAVKEGDSKVKKEVAREVEESTELKSGGGKYDRVWLGPVRLVADTGPINGVTGSAPFLLTNFDEDSFFHLLVPRGDVIEQYTHSSKSILDGLWTQVATLQSPSDVPGTKITAVTFVQSSQGKFEAVARVTSPNERYSYLVGYELDAVNHQKEWTPPFRFVADTGPIDKVTGSPIIIESDFGAEDRFHLLVPQDDVTVQYTLAVGSFSQGQWKSFATLNPFQNLPVTAVSLVENQVGGFEAVTRVQGSQGDELVIGYELKPGATQWSEGVALSADDGPILAGKPPKEPTQEPPTDVVS